jgi:hypothetical protein
VTIRASLWAPEWFRLAPFQVRATLQTTDTESREYSTSIALLALVKVEHKIAIRRVVLDSRKSLGRLHGESDLDAGTIRLVRPDLDTALHEAAHIWSGDGHTTKWANCYLTLCELYDVPSTSVDKVINVVRTRRARRKAKGR